MKPRQYRVPSDAIEVLNVVVLSEAAIDANKNTDADAASDRQSPPSGNIVVSKS